MSAADEAWDGTTAAEDNEVVTAILPQMRALLAAKMLTIVELIAKRHYVAGYRDALEHAADAVEEPTGSVCDWGHATEDDCNGECSTLENVTPLVSAQWLRARAAAVAPRETKD